MLTNSPIRPTIPMVDLNRAKRFYETILVLKPVPDNNDDTTSSIAIFECGNNTLIELYQRRPSKADHTVATFEVSNIEESQYIKRKGVNFEEYDMPEIKTQNGIARQGSVKAAWFKDSEGNILVFIRQ